MSLARYAVLYVILMLLAFGALMYGVVLPRLFTFSDAAAALIGGAILLALTPPWLFLMAWAFNLLVSLRTPKDPPTRPRPLIPWTRPTRRVPFQDEKP